MCRISLCNLLSLLSEFKAGYFTIGDQIAAFGGPDWSSSDAVGGADDKFGPKLKRNAVKGSPVVPKSAKLIKEDNEYALYAVTILRGHYTAGYFTDGVFTAGKLISCVLSPIAEG